MHASLSVTILRNTVVHGVYNTGIVLIQLMFSLLQINREVGTVQRKPAKMAGSRTPKKGETSDNSVAPKPIAVAQTPQKSVTRRRKRREREEKE